MMPGVGAGVRPTCRKGIKGRYPAPCNRLLSILDLNSARLFWHCPYEREEIPYVLLSFLNRMRYAVIWHRNVITQEIEYERNRHWGVWNCGI